MRIRYSGISKFQNPILRLSNFQISKFQTFNVQIFKFPKSPNPKNSKIQISRNDGTPISHKRNKIRNPQISKCNMSLKWFGNLLLC